MIFKDVYDPLAMIDGKLVSQRLSMDAPTNADGTAGTRLRGFAVQGKANDGAGPVDLWPANIQRTYYDTNGFTLSISSSSSSDTAAGTGARTVLLDCIEATTFKRLTLTLTLNGTSRVTDTSGYKISRINDMIVLTAGSGTSNVGDIWAYDSTDTIVAGVPQTATKKQGLISAGNNVSLHGWFTVPKGYKVAFRGFFCGITDLAPSNKYARLTYAATRNIVNPGDIPLFNKFPLPISLNGGGNGMYKLYQPVLLDELQEFRFILETSSSVEVSAYFEGIIFPKG